MRTRHFALLAILAALCVLGIFMFPAARGPFQVTSGPTTAFRALRVCLLMMCSMAAAAGLAAGVLSLRPVFLMAAAEAPPMLPILSRMASPLLR